MYHTGQRCGVDCNSSIEDEYSEVQTNNSKSFFLLITVTVYESKHIVLDNPTLFKRPVPEILPNTDVTDNILSPVKENFSSMACNVGYNVVITIKQTVTKC